MPIVGKEFKPREPYTHRLRKILDEYPDGSQILREILQNSDDAKSSEQVFILDHNTYNSNSLLEPHLVNNYKRTNLKLDRYQGPALLAINDTIFEERDFQSLLKLADSEKHDQFDKIGVMGVGFNSIYHITDSPSFITGDKYVILDPHEWYFPGGFEFEFGKELVEESPDQFAPFRISCNESYQGTIFRYPLRTNEDSIDSKISNKIYKPKAILDMFHKFYEKESINCLLFLKYIERIYFYELKEGATEPELLYAIQLENSDNHIRQQRRSIVEKIIPMMESLKSKKLKDNNQLEASYVASFSRKRKNDPKEISSWLILNYLDDLLKAEAYFQKNFEKYIGDYKFIPNVGLAVPLNDLNTTGRLLCFLPLPIDMPFFVSVHGYFAVSTNRRSLWSPADNEDLAIESLARVKVEWNKYLFEQVLPKAWVKFLCELRSNIQSDNLYKYWPIVKDATSNSIGSFCSNLLQNVIERLNIDDCVFKGPPSSSIIGKVAEVPADLYNVSSFQESKFHWLSLLNGYLEDEKSFNYDLHKIIGNIGFPVISALHPIINVLKDSRHQESLKHFSPAVIRTYLNHNRDRWENSITRKEILQLFEYVLKELDDQNFDELEGFKMIPLADGTLGTLTQSSNDVVYIGPDDDITSNENDERNIFTNQLNKFIDKSIDFKLYKCLYDNANAGWDLNIKILDESSVVNMIKFSLNFSENADHEEIPNHYEWIYQLWNNLRYRNWDLTKFEDIHLIPTSRSTLRKLRTPKKIFLDQISDELSTIFDIFGAVFIENKFKEISGWDKISSYIINPNDIISVLTSFRTDTSYPENLNHNLQIHEVPALVEHLSNYLRINKNDLTPEIIDVIKYLPIFTKADHASPISLSGNTNWYLLPREEENSYGKIIYPSNMGGFLSANSQNMCYILEDIIEIPRLTVIDYWRNYVIPFLELQLPEDIDIVVEKLFDRLPSLLDQDPNLKNILGEKSFVPAGTLEMSRQQTIPFSIKLVKPQTELYDPEATITDLFFEDEKVFPAGKYASNKYLSNLKLLGIKSILSPNDIVSRIGTIVERKQFSNIQNLVHKKAFRLLKYIDEQWDQLVNNNGDGSLEIILEEEWIPTVDVLGNNFFSKPQDCYCKKYKNLVCFIAPILDYNPKNKKFLRCLNWDTYPDVKRILMQLEYCCDYKVKKNSIKEIKSICNAIYEYMNETFKAKDVTSEFNFMNEYLKNKSWILCGDTFHSSEKVVINLPEKYQYKDSLIVKLPIEYQTSKFMDLFRAMGVRNEIGIKELIWIIRNEHKDLSINEIVQILKQIVELKNDNQHPMDESEVLDELLIPSTEDILVDLNEIQFDDMKNLLIEEKSKYKIAHHLVTWDIAKELRIQTLKGTIFVNNNTTEDINWKIYEQVESLTTKIKNIIKNCSISSIFKEFLQNADDSQARQFLVIVDERPNFQHDPSKKSFFSEEMEDWQGPAIWIYNDKEFTNDDFQSLLNFGIGGKLNDDTKIGRFGIGFNHAFHLTDLPSFVSGKYITFLDPHANFLPPTGFPPVRPRGTRIDFSALKFKEAFPDQCYPYDAIFDFINNSFSYQYKSDDVSKRFKGTLFRFPLRTHKLARQSDISDQVFRIEEILKQFINIRDNNEMLFLRNIESCSLYHLTNKNKDPQLIWRTKINNAENCRKFRQKVTDGIDDARIYQLDIEKDYIQDRRVSEIWAICTGGHDTVKPEFKNFSEEKLLKPRGGVASLLARSYEQSFDELRADSFPNPPELTGEIYSYLSLSIISDLNVHLSGNFSLPRDFFISNIFSNCDGNAKWNKYILHDVLPDLHAKLLEYIVRLEEARQKKERNDFIPHTATNFWPIPKEKNIMVCYENHEEVIHEKKEREHFIPCITNNFQTPKKTISVMYKNYGLNVIRKLGLKNQNFFWTEVNGGKFVSLQEARIIDKKNAIIADLLIGSGVSAVKLDLDIIRQLNKIVESKNPSNFPCKLITGESVCEKLHEIPDIYDKIDNNRDSLFELLDFILQDKNSFEFLTGLQLVPLSDESVGQFGESYYIGTKEHLELFPNVGPAKFVSTDLPENLVKIFNNEDFPAFTNIKKFGVSAVLDLLMFELRPLKEKVWDPLGSSIPNNDWLEKIWLILSKINEKEFIRLSKYPLLPVIKPPKLIRIDMNNPLIHIPRYDAKDPLLSALIKLGVRFTNMNQFPEGTHLDLKKCIVENNTRNIINSLEGSRSLLTCTMDELFKGSDLTLSDYEALKKFIKKELKTLGGHGRRNLIEILKSLPIWPTHSSEDKFINATTGILLSYRLPFFSFNTNTKFYKYDSISDFDTLSSLDANFMYELDYLKNYIIPQITESLQTPSKEYITFLQYVLSIGDRRIEQYLEQYQVIPNKTLTSIVRADTLYSSDEILFLNIFEQNRFLPPDLQNNRVYLDALKRIGLNHRVDCSAYIKCAQEIESQFQQQDRFPFNIVKNRAKYLIDYLYTYISNLNFSSDQWNQIIKIKFVPSEKYLESPFQEEAKETLGFESFAVLCFQRYKEVCWTTKPLFERSVEPTNPFCEKYSTIGKPTLKDVIKHWFLVVKEIKSKISWTSSDIRNVMEKIYKKMNASSQEESMEVLIKLEVNDPNKKIFLNGDDPLDEKSWVAGNELVFGIQEDIKEGMYKVKPCLMPYKSLLLLAGAYEINIEELEKLEELEKSRKLKISELKIDQRNMLVNDLLDKLIRQDDNEYHDVFFTFDGEKTKIGANRYVLSAASTYFKKMFYGGLSESIKEKIEVSIKDIHSDIFSVLLRWLYGQSSEDAIKSVLRNPDDFNKQNYLSFIINLLQVTDIYDVESLKDEAEDIIIKGRYIGIYDLYKILTCSEEFNAQQLRNYYEKYIKSNRKLVKEQLSKLHTNVTNDKERSEISEMSKMLDPFLSDNGD